jgi:hypothetical protein
MEMYGKTIEGDCDGEVCVRTKGLEFAVFSLSQIEKGKRMGKGREKGGYDGTYQKLGP